MRGMMLYDGPSGNADVKALLGAAASLGVDLDIVPPSALTLMLDPAKPVIPRDGEETAPPDFAIAAFASDPSYANLALLEQLETIGVFCVNRASVMRRTKDKLLTLQLLSRAGIPVSKTFLHRPGTDLSVYERELGFPLVLKVIGGSKGKGVVLVDDKSRLEDFLGLARAAGATEEILLQKLVSTSKGRDLRVMIVGGKAVDCAMRQTVESDGFLANVSAGGSMANHPLNDDIAKLATASAEALGLFIGGMDLLFTENGYVVCEANSVPGITLPRGLPSPWSIDIPKAILESIIKACRRQLEPKKSY